MFEAIIHSGFKSKVSSKKRKEISEKVKSSTFKLIKKSRQVLRIIIKIDEETFELINKMSIPKGETLSEVPQNRLKRRLLKLSLRKQKVLGLSIKGLKSYINLINDVAEYYDSPYFSLLINLRIYARDLIIGLNRIFEFEKPKKDTLVYFNTPSEYIEKTNDMLDSVVHTLKNGLNKLKEDEHIYSYLSASSLLLYNKLGKRKPFKQYLDAVEKLRDNFGKIPANLAISPYVLFAIPILSIAIFSSELAFLREVKTRT